MFANAKNILNNFCVSSEHGRIKPKTNGENDPINCTMAQRVNKTFLNTQSIAEELREETDKVLESNDNASTQPNRGLAH